MIFARLILVGLEDFQASPWNQELRQSSVELSRYPPTHCSRVLNEHSVLDCRSVHAHRRHMVEVRPATIEREREEREREITHGSDNE